MLASARANAHGLIGIKQIHLLRACVSNANNLAAWPKLSSCRLSYDANRKPAFGQK